MHLPCKAVPGNPFSGQVREVSGQYLIFECPKRWGQHFASHRTAIPSVLSCCSWVKALLGLCAALPIEHMWEGRCLQLLPWGPRWTWNKQKSISVMLQLAAIPCRAAARDWIDRINVTPGGLPAANQKTLVLMSEAQWRQLVRWSQPMSPLL